jgi:hypothetical protein
MDALASEAEPGLVEVARIIAGPEGGGWLVSGLAHFSSLVGGEGRSLKEDTQLAAAYDRMDYAAAVLIKKLPMFLPLPGGLWVRDAQLALDALVRLKPLLAINLRSRMKPKKGRGGGPRPNARQQICAEVVVEAWRIVHPDWSQEADIEICEACAAYWRACGGAGRGGDIENWRRDIRRAIAKPTPAWRNILLHYKALATRP